MKRTRQRVSRRETTLQDDGARQTRRVVALLLFASALAVRLLFWQATPDRDWGWSVYLKGDAPLWIESARALEADRPFELGLPIHPPGPGHLAAILWDGSTSTLPWLRYAWAAIGAFVAPLLFLAVVGPFGMRVAVIAGTWTALSSGLMLLSTTISSEAPYLVLTLLSLWLLNSLVENPRVGRVIAFSAVNAAACLFRVEHILFYAPILVFLIIRWRRQRNARASRWALASVAAFVLVLTPWHLSSWSAIRRYNEQPRQLAPSEERAVRTVEEALADVPWTQDALRRREELPNFVRRTMAAFVLATVVHRGGVQVRGEDFRIIEEAFGSIPRPLARYPFVSSAGPLNFALANHDESTGGFDRSPLETPPRLAGGPDQYPPFLIQGLPPPDLTFVYPPHVHLFNDGYAIGWKWIRDNPQRFARLVARKLSNFWSGAATGFTGYGVPTGLWGPRRAVDMVTPDPSGGTTAWRLLILGAACVGLAAGWRTPALWPWLLFLLTRLAVTAAFFGYARQGALAVPLLGVLVGIAAERWIFRRRAEAPAATVLAVAAVLIVGIGVETARYLAKPVVKLDGQRIGATDPFPADVHRSQRLESD